MCIRDSVWCTRHAASCRRRTSTSCKPSSPPIPTSCCARSAKYCNNKKSRWKRLIILNFVPIYIIQMVFSRRYWSEFNLQRCVLFCKIAVSLQLYLIALGSSFEEKSCFQIYPGGAMCSPHWHSHISPSLR